MLEKMDYFVGKTRIEILLSGSRITLPDGTVVEGVPHDTDSYRDTAQSLGYGDDTLAMCQDHDPLHVLLCHWLGLDQSFSLTQPDTELAAVEEAAVMAVQKFTRMLLEPVGTVSV